jgi:hypothetical protein
MADAKGPEVFTAAEFAPLLAAYLNAGGTEPATARLTALYDRWCGGQAPAHGRQWAEADLNGDGVNELLTAVGGFQTGNPGEAAWGLLVIAGQPGQWHLDLLELPRQDVGFFYGAKLLGTPDLDDTGKPVMVWQLVTAVGATGGPTQIVAARWAPGSVEQLGAPVRMPNMRTATLDGNVLAVNGGVTGGASGGAWQRLRTDRFRWEQGQFRLIDREFAPSSLIYHRLQDGIVAETLGRTQDAAAAYKDAAAPGAPVVANPHQLQQPDQAKTFGAAIRSLAQLRLGALQLNLGDAHSARQVLLSGQGPFAGLTAAASEAASAEEACRRAEAWAADHAEFFKALALPAGYGNPTWAPGRLCGPITFEGLE